SKIFSRNLKHPHLELRGEKGKNYILLDRKTQLTYVFQKWARGRLWLSQIRDRNDNTIDFHYNDLTGLYAVCRSNGDSIEVQSVDWKIYRISMGGRELARYAYTKRGYLMEAHSFQYGSLFYQYNARTFITSWRDTKATRVHYVYDG